MERIKILEQSRIGDGINITDGRVVSFYTHTHLYYEMLIYDGFTGDTVINGKRVGLERPTLALISPSAFHCTRAENAVGARFVNISFSERMLDDSPVQRLGEPIILTDYRRNELLCRLIERLCESGRDLLSRRVLLNALMLELSEQGERIARLEPSRSVSIVLEAERIICREFGGELDLESAAARIHVSPQYLSVVFKKYMGIGFSEFLCETRLKYAYSLLCEGGMNVTEICYACGYRNLSHFLRSFKRYYGLTPGRVLKKQL